MEREQSSGRLAKVDVVSASAAETKRLGRCLGKRLVSGNLIFLIGPFGAGKTTLVQGIAQGLGVKDVVNSPSFTLANEYDIPGGKLYHLDLYRIERPEEALALGLDEYLGQHAICVIEWPEQGLAALPLERIEIRMSFLGGNRRRIELMGQGFRHEDIAMRFAEYCVPLTLKGVDETTSV